MVSANSTIKKLTYVYDLLSGGSGAFAETMSLAYMMTNSNDWSKISDVYEQFDLLGVQVEYVPYYIYDTTLPAGLYTPPLVDASYVMDSGVPTSIASSCEANQHTVAQTRFRWNLKPMNKLNKRGFLAVEVLDDQEFLGYLQHIAVSGSMPNDTYVFSLRVTFMTRWRKSH